MGGKQRLTRRAALTLMGSGAVLAAGKTFGFTEATTDRSSSVSVADDSQAALGIDRLPPNQFNTVALTNNTTTPMALSATAASGVTRVVTPSDAPLTLAAGETRRVAFSTDGATTNDTLELTGTITQNGEQTVVVDLDRAIEIDIPDYIEQKGFAWWPCVLDSGNAVVDVLGGDHDGTAIAPNWVDGAWTDGVAIEGNGSSSVVETTTLGTFGDRLDKSFAIAFTIEAPHDQGQTTIMGARAQSSNSTPYFQVYHTNNWFGIDNSIGLNVGHNYAAAAGDNALPNGEPARVVVNVPDSNPANWEIYIDGVPVTTSIPNNGRNGTVNASGTLQNEFQLFGSGYADRPLDGVLDDVLLFDDALTCAEVQADYSRQPYGSGGDSANCSGNNGGGNNGGGNNGGGNGNGQYPKWDQTTLYMTGDKVRHKGTVWVADLDSRNAEPSASSPYWSAVA